MSCTASPPVSHRARLDAARPEMCVAHRAQGDDMVKVVAWYDNEWGYSQRVVDLAEICAANWE
jgi:glyceraldehyde-3-phosphate dehydrogenase/erythrose-4-phosphate dehydrogenase